MGAALKWVMRTIGFGIIWVFILSINVKGRELFDYANSVLVKNRMVDAADEKLGLLWDRVSETFDRAVASGSDSEVKTKL